MCFSLENIDLLISDIQQGMFDVIDNDYSEILDMITANFMRFIFILQFVQLHEIDDISLWHEQFEFTAKEKKNASDSKSMQNKKRKNNTHNSQNGN